MPYFRNKRYEEEMADAEKVSSPGESTAIAEAQEQGIDYDAKKVHRVPKNAYEENEQGKYLRKLSRMVDKMRGEE